jgi:UPF0176 protein
VNIQIISFYKFFSIPKDQIAAFEARLYQLAKNIDELAGAALTARGLCIMGTEGVNSTFSVPKIWADEFKKQILAALGISDVTFKDSFADKHAFHDFKVKIREEIVTLERPDLIPNGSRHHITPAEWNRVMREENPIVIDTRNSYEYDIGRFKGALDPKIEEFNEYPDWVKKADLPKSGKKILIYCTGGIRCEKAILEMNEQGFENVYQLDGGILNYLKEFPNQQFEGDCFVFDYRIAVDQNLEPSETYKLCPHCGQPAKTKINCVQCGLDDTVCDSCLAQGDEFKTCSKNCAHHKRMGHTTTRIHKDAFNRRQIGV